MSPESEANGSAPAARHVACSRVHVPWLQSVRRFAGAVAAAAGVTHTSGCYAHVSPQPDYVEASAPPVAYGSAPTYYYDGRPVYYVEGRWYARDGDHWRYYRNEPPTLYRRRLH